MEKWEATFDSNPLDHNLVSLKKANAELFQALSMEEAFWRQKAAVKWVEDGEHNTKYFHSLVIKRRHRAVIHKIVKENRDTVTRTEEIGASAVEHFQSLLTDQQGGCSDSNLRSYRAC